MVKHIPFVPHPQAELSRQRDERGVFRAHTPYPPGSVPVRRLTLPSVLPAYLEPDFAWTKESVPPTILAAMQLGQKPLLWGKQFGDPVEEVNVILNKLAACLYDRAHNRWRELEAGGGQPQPILPLGNAFVTPLADAEFPDRPACMWLNPVLVKKAKGIHLHSNPDAKMGMSGYTQIHLCTETVKRGRRRMDVMEYAHRFVYWAMVGAPRPPLTWDTAVLLHICQEAGCLNPMHMRWGTQADNLEQARA